MEQIKIILPLMINKSKNKMFSLNLNQYRNAHFQTLNTAKRNFEKFVSGLNIKHKFTEPVEITYIIHPPTKRKYDISNIASIVDKFACDALIKCGVLQEDNYEHVTKITYLHGGIDKNNPRAEMLIAPRTAQRGLFAITKEIKGRLERGL